MFSIGSDTRIYLFGGATDMRKGAGSLYRLVEGRLSCDSGVSSLFVFRGKRSDRIKILYWDGQGFCLFYKCLERGKFVWPNSESTGDIGITYAQLSMLLEGIDWRNPRWSSPPIYAS